MYQRRHFRLCSHYITRLFEFLFYSSSFSLFQFVWISSLLNITLLFLCFLLRSSSFSYSVLKCHICCLLFYCFWSFRLFEYHPLLAWLIVNKLSFVLLSFLQLRCHFILITTLIFITPVCLFMWQLFITNTCLLMSAQSYLKSIRLICSNIYLLPKVKIVLVNYWVEYLLPLQCSFKKRYSDERKKVSIQTNAIRLKWSVIELSIDCFHQQADILRLVEAVMYSTLSIAKKKKKQNNYKHEFVIGFVW